MPDYRVIKASILDSPRYGQLDIFAQHLFIVLSLLADDQGRVQGHPAWVRSRGYPYQDIALSDVLTGLATLERAGLIIRYTSDNDLPLIQIATWWDDQNRMQWAYPSAYPPPPTWIDRLRYRAKGRVVTVNWHSSPSSEEHPSDSPPPETPVPGKPSEPPKPLPNSSGDNSGNALGKALPKASGKAPRRDEEEKRKETRGDESESSSPSSPEEGGPGGGTVFGGGEGGGGTGQTAPETHPAQGAGAPRAPVRPRNNGQPSRKAAPVGPDAAPKPQSLAEGPPSAPVPPPGGGKKTPSPRKRRKKHPPPEDPRVKLLHAAGITNGKVPKILARGAALEDILAELARCYDPASGVRRPELIVPRHLLAGEKPPATYRQPQVWQQHIPDAVLQAAGLDGWLRRRVGQTAAYRRREYEPQAPVPDASAAQPDAPLEVRQAWKRLMDELEADMPRAEFETWVRSVRLLAYRDGTVILGARNAYARDWLSDRLSIIVQRGLTGMLDRDIRVQFEVV